MNTLDYPDHTVDHIAPDLLLRLQTKTMAISMAATILVEHGAIEDETDRSLITEAVVFINNPTELIERIVSHTTNIGQVLSGYMMQGKDFPPAIDALHGYLFALQCINRMNAIEQMLEYDPPDDREIKQIMVMALQDAEVLSSGYKDDTFLTVLAELQARINN